MFALLAIALLASDIDALAIARAQLRVLIAQQQAKAAGDAAKAEEARYVELERKTVKAAGKDPDACGLDDKQEIRCK